MLPDWLPWLLQVNDSQYPSGAYAHSLGLEELVECGAVTDAAGLEDFLGAQIVPSLCAFELPILAEAHRAAQAGDTARLADLDFELDAWKPAVELREASRRMGSRRLALLRSLSPADVLERFAALASPQHQIVVCALEFREVPAAAAACALALQTVTGYVAAGVKLLRLGQERAQKVILANMRLLAPRIERSVAAPPPGGPGWFNPLLEIASLRHVRARERLFIS